MPTARFRRIIGRITAIWRLKCDFRRKSRINTAICRPDYDFRRKISRYTAVRKTKTRKQIFSAPIYSHEDPVDNQMQKAVEESDPKGELRDIAWSRCFVQR
ncbi:MAG: hypothetical protein KBT08_01995, partial [Bacteroidales bacterium]|nr:hypothetical protein [Candidatus Cryptobacteroides onthequi]